MAFTSDNGKPTSESLRDNGATPYASQIMNDSSASGTTLADALTAISALGSLSYRGTWNANANTPALASSVGTKGFYYVVSVDGATNLDGITDWKVGDWAIFNGTAWQKIDNTDAVSSVFGRTGPVVAAASDYDASQVDNDSTVAGTFVSGALNTLGGIVAGRKRVVATGLHLETVNDEVSVALGGSAADEFCPITAIFHMEDVGVGAAANGDAQVTIGISTGGVQILAGTTLTNLINLNDKFIVDLSVVVKAAIPGDSTIYVKVTSADTTAGADHLADCYIIGETFVSGT